MKYSSSFSYSVRPVQKLLQKYQKQPGLWDLEKSMVSGGSTIRCPLSLQKPAIGQVDVAYVPNLKHPSVYNICVRSRARPNNEKGGRVYGVA